MEIEKLKTGLYIGRFQPFHLGHLSAIKQALKKVKNLYIGIGSSQYHHSEQNPFTAEERMEMLKVGLKEAGLESKCKIFLIPDIHNEEGWAKHVKKIVPHFELIFVGNEGLVKNLFEKENMKVIVVHQELNISASQIRKEILSDLNWKTKVSLKVAEFLESIDAIKRIKKLQD